MLAAIRRASSLLSSLPAERQLTSYPVVSGKASLSVNTRYCTRYRCRPHMRPHYKPANWSAPRDDVWLPLMLPIPA
jgi:hypothetical protein